MEEMKIVSQSKCYDRKEMLESLGEGEWIDEFDITEWEYRGYIGYVKRQFRMRFGGHLCGYVFIPEGNKSYDVADLDIDVHGGITYDEKKESGRVIGFDCAHSGDYLPSMEVDSPKDEEGNGFCTRLGDVYRDMEYCLGECRKMVDQIEERV